VRRLFTAALAACLLVVACGDDAATTTTTGSGADNQALVAALGSKISSSPQASTSDFQFDDQSIACFAGGLVDQLGADVVAANIDKDFDAFMATLDQTQRRTVVDVLFDCVNVADAMVAGMAAEGSGMSEASTRCVLDAMLASNEFRDAVAESFVSGDSTFESDALIAAMLPIFFQCLTPEELANLGNG
jgi:hypothetical protein